MKSEFSDKILQLVDDESFVRWVNSDFEDDKAHWSAIQEKESNLHIINEAIALVKALRFHNKTIPQERKQRLFARIENSISTGRVVSIDKGRKKVLARIIAVAASLLLVVSLYWPRNNEQIINTQYAEQVEISLPDDSQVVLNADSKLNYGKNNFVSKRELHLEGEGFFKVKKGEQFIVKTRLGNVEVIGTSFNVYVRDDNFEVVCETGKVKVSNIDESSFVILTPGESSILLNKIISKSERKFNGDDWIKGLYHFEGSPLEEVISELERQFDISIIFDGINKEELYTGFFEKSDLDKALESVFWTLGLKFEKMQDNTIKLSK